MNVKEIIDEVFKFDGRFYKIKKSTKKNKTYDLFLVSFIDKNGNIGLNPKEAKDLLLKYVVSF